MFSMILISVLTSASFQAPRETIRLESPALAVEVDAREGTWFLIDRRSSTRWPSEGASPAGFAEGLKGGFTPSNRTETSVRLATTGGAAVVFSLVDENRSLEIRFEGKNLCEVRIPGEVFRLHDGEAGAVVVPCREGLLIPADSGVAFEQTFGSSEYEGCHMNMIGFLKRGSALLATWDDANVWATLHGRKLKGPSHQHELMAELSIRPPARAIRITPLGKGDWNTLAEGYRRIAERKGLASTMTQKIARNAHAERLLGAANVKLWTCLNRRMNEESSRVEHEEVEWTFDEAAQIAEHIKKDLGIDRCLFILGGWTEGGYDVRHPDALPANKECGGDIALSSAVRRIQDLGYVGCLHDNYQDMYRDAKSWDPKFIQKRKDGSLTAGGRWLGGRAYLV